MKADLIACRRGAARLSLIGAILALLAAPARAQDHAWVQYAAQGLEARAVSESGACPAATIDGRAASMEPRAAPDRDFPVAVCALPLPAGARSVAIGETRLALPRRRANRILALGDTGCRLKGIFLQDCNSPTAWPFRRVAEAAAAVAPDVVIHLGDYYYRETFCPPLRDGCAGSPHGDNWQAWKADFFDPAAALLRAAPFVFVRGNHEDCARGWRGWSRLLSPFPPASDSACRSREPAYQVDLGAEPKLLVLDVTTAQDRFADPEGAERFVAELAAARAVEGPVWYAFHKPIYSTVRIAGGETVGDNKTLAQAARGGLPANVQAILSGHLHTFQVASYVEDYPAQFVVGHGGDTLDLFVPSTFDGLKIDPVTVEKGRSVGSAFGFATFERSADGWDVTDYDVDMKPLLRCRLRGRKLACD